MTQTRKISVSLTPQMAEEVHQAVADGEYASPGEVMREALRDWQIRRVQRSQAIEELRRQYDIGIASGPAGDGDEAFARIEAALTARIGGRPGSR